MSNKEAGQSLLELVVVIAVLVIVIGALTVATIASLRNAQFSQNQIQATKLAQEGLEWVRGGRDRNECINNMTTVNPPVNSWNGYSADPNCPGFGSIWNYHIGGDCETALGKCYFNVNSSGILTNIGFNSANFPTNLAEIPSGSPIFKRAIIVSDDMNGNKNFSDDDATRQNAKIVTAIVQWNDFSGPHESRLTTILRRI